MFCGKKVSLKLICIVVLLVFSMTCSNVLAKEPTAEESIVLQFKKTNLNSSHSDIKLISLASLPILEEENGTNDIIIETPLETTAPAIIENEKKESDEPLLEENGLNVEEIDANLGEENIDNANIVPNIDVNPNEVGDIMILMYHHIVTYKTNSNLHRNAEDFRKDLQRLYDDGYRLVKLEDLINNNIKIEAGFTPVVLTFDDGWSTAFSFEEVDGELVPKENCAVDIINKFAEEYPDFGRTAMFYVNGYMEPFKGAGTLEQRMKYLVDNGYEIGNHTYSHNDLSKRDRAGIQNEIVSLDLYVKNILPDYEMLSLCYPYGNRPKEGMRDLAIKGEYAGHEYNYKWALRAGPTKASAAINNVKFDPLNVPRVRATNNAEMDMWWFLDYYRDNPDQKYISDGDPDTISVPKGNESQVNMNSLNEKILNLF